MCEEAKIDMKEGFKNQFKDLNLILKELECKEVAKAMEWARKNEGDLEKLGSDLLFLLHK